MEDIRLDGACDLLIEDGDLVIGDSNEQDVLVILQLNQGELKSDPLLGPNLTQQIRANRSRAQIQKRVRMHLERDNKDINDLNITL